MLQECLKPIHKTLLSPKKKEKKNKEKTVAPAQGQEGKTEKDGIQGARGIKDAEAVAVAQMSGKYAKCKLPSWLTSWLPSCHPDCQL